MGENGKLSIITLNSRKKAEEVEGEEVLVGNKLSYQDETGCVLLLVEIFPPIWSVCLVRDKEVADFLCFLRIASHSLLKSSSALRDKTIQLTNSTGRWLIRPHISMTVEHWLRLNWALNCCCCSDYAAGWEWEWKESKEGKFRSCAQQLCAIYYY